VDTRNPDRPNLAGAKTNNTEGTSSGCGRLAAGTPLGTPDLWFDPCVFELLLTGILGDLDCSAVRGEGVVQLDFGLSKQFEVTERVGTQFRAEFFNIINTANFAHPSASLFTNSGGRCRRSSWH
jgi:hypothetical protein